MATTYSYQENVIARLAMKWVGKGKTVEETLRSVSPSLLRTLARLEQLVRLIDKGRRWDPLPRVDLSESTKKVKRFCEGILEPCVRHEWKPRLRRQSLRDRVLVASTLFLFRKAVVQPGPSKEEVKESIRAYIDKMTTPQSIPSSDLLANVKQQIRKMFKRGWDKNWDREVDSYSLPTTSCLENAKRKGGARGLDRARLRAEYEEFVSGVKTSLSPLTKPMIVQTGGKSRLVTSFSATRSFLSPLHHLLYDYMSKEKWLLRGDATEQAFEGFEVKEGEVFVSGDYESATDNLNIHLSRYVLACIRSRSLHVPCNVWDSAEVTLACEFPGSRKQQSGQLMGSLLSFPLLCLVNYLTFRYAVPRDVPVRVNGDDIVFRCTPVEKEKWFRLVQDSGLVVSKGKTLVSRRCFSLNSTFFLASVGGIRLIPSIRSKCLFGKALDPMSIKGRLESVYTGSGVLKDLVQSHLLREVGVQVRSTQRSVRRGLGGRCSNRALRWAGLLDRESFYNSLPFERPLPMTRKEWMQNAVPDGFERVSSTLGDDPMFFHFMMENTWCRSPKVGNKETMDEFWLRVKEDTFSYFPQFTEKRRKLLRVTKEEFQKLKHFVSAHPPVGELCWRKKKESGGPVSFVSANGLSYPRPREGVRRNFVPKKRRTAGVGVGADAYEEGDEIDWEEYFQ